MYNIIRGGTKNQINILELFDILINPICIFEYKGIYIKYYVILEKREIF